MNFAFSTIIFFLLLLPGQIFRRYYFTGEFSRQYFTQTINELFVAVFIPSLVLHGLWILLVPVFSHYVVDLRILGELILSKDYPANAFATIQKYIHQIILYHLSIFIFSAGIGFLLKFVVRKTGFDLRFKLFRFQNSWHYILSGEFFGFYRVATPLMEDTIADIEVRYVDALVEVGGVGVIYDGILVDYELSKDGGLEYLTLFDVNRRYMKDDPIQEGEEEETSGDSEEDAVKSEEFHNAGELSGETPVEVPALAGSDTKMEEQLSYHITGDILVIPYNKIINLNMSYYKVVQIDDENYDVVEVQ